MFSVARRPIEITFVGSFSTSSARELGYLTEFSQLLSTLAEAPQVSYVIEHDASVSLPEIVSKHIRPLSVNLSEHFECSRVAILFNATSTARPDIVKAAADGGAYLILDEVLAQKNPWLSPSTFSTIYSTQDILASLSQYFSSPLLDLWISVSLASRGNASVAAKKCEEAKVYYGSVEGVQTFCTSQLSKVRGNV